MRTFARIGVLVTFASAMVVAPATVASAQDPGVIGNVDISFDVGDFDNTSGDWTIDAVEVSGELEDGQEFTLQLTGADDEVVWETTARFVAPTTRIPVTETVTVGEVAGAGVSQGITEVAGVQIEPPKIDFGASGSGGGGQLALSMVLAVLLVAIVFRTPLPLGVDPTVDPVMRRLVLLGVLLLLALPFSGPTAAAQSTDPVQIEAVLAGQDIATADSNNPIKIEPKEEIPLLLTMRNTSDDTVTVRYVRLEGTALGLTFLTYDLGVRTRLAPGEQTTLDTTLDFFNLESQATGYLGTSLRVYDPARRLLGSEDFVVDVQGNATSTLGLFAFVVLGVAIFSTTVLVLNTLRRRLPPNRFVRGVQFAIAGAAIGVTLSLGLSILRITFADVDAWVPLVFVPTVIGFLLGYIAPGPLSRSIRDVREEEALQVVATTAVARASGIYDPATSGSYNPDRASGSVPAQHESGEHVPVAHASGEHAAVTHASGEHTPAEGSSTDEPTE